MVTMIGYYTIFCHDNVITITVCAHASLNNHPFHGISSFAPKQGKADSVIFRRKKDVAI